MGAQLSVIFGFAILLFAMLAMTARLTFRQSEKWEFVAPLSVQVVFPTLVMLRIVARLSAMVGVAALQFVMLQMTFPPTALLGAGSQQSVT